MKKIIYSDIAPAPIGPYSQAVLYGNMLFASGQIAICAQKNEMILSSIEAETHQVMKNIKAVLDEAGFEFKDILKCSIFLSDMDNFGIVNAVYGTYFEFAPPARETVEVSRLPKDVNVEISFIAGR